MKISLQEYLTGKVLFVKDIIGGKSKTLEKSYHAK